MSLERKLVRPNSICVAITPNDEKWLGQRLDGLEGSWRTDVAKMPDFVGGSQLPYDLIRKVVVGVGQYGD